MVNQELAVLGNLNGSLWHGLRLVSGHLAFRPPPSPCQWGGPEYWLQVPLLRSLSGLMKWWSESVKVLFYTLQ